MLLIKQYQPTKHKTLNNNALCQTCDKCVPQKYKNLPYQTTSLSLFDNLKPEDIQTLFQEQLKSATEEADLHLKYSFLNQGTYNKTIEQYQTFFFYNNHAYIKAEINNYIAKDLAYDSTYISKPAPPKPIPPTKIQLEQLQEELQKNNQRGVSRQAIRNITGYTYTPIPRWDTEEKKEVYIEWQHKILEDTNKLIIVNGSRQIGKSWTIAEKAIELSFLPNNNTLVGAFTTTTSNVIRDYMLGYIRNFPKNTFTHTKSERFIINNKTGTKIWFKTLADDAQSILGMTLKHIIVDEAQLISEFIFEEVLIPTLATTGGTLTMILTPGRKRTGYAFKKIMEIKKGIKKNASLYNVDITMNPFIDPETRAYVMARKDDPAIRRQWFCEWNDGGDQLFNIPKSTDFPILSSEGYFVLGKDPARLRDRSGYSLIYVHEGTANIITSGYVPDHYKKDWGLQAKFYKDLIENYIKKDFKNWYNVIDVSGVGDGVAKIFTDAGIRFIGKIRYSAGNTESISGIDYRVGKSLLINTMLDMIQEGNISIFDSTNKDLLEEISYLNQTDTKTGQIAMESSFFDDITNATMIAVYIVAKLGLLNRKVTHNTFKSSGIKSMDAIENPHLHLRESMADAW